MGCSGHERRRRLFGSSPRFLAFNAAEPLPTSSSIRPLNQMGRPPPVRRIENGHHAHMCVLNIALEEIADPLLIFRSGDWAIAATFNVAGSLTATSAQFAFAFVLGSNLQAGAALLTTLQRVHMDLTTSTAPGLQFPFKCRRSGAGPDSAGPSLSNCQTGSR